MKKKTFDLKEEGIKISPHASLNLGTNLIIDRKAFYALYAKYAKKVREEVLLTGKIRKRP